MFSFVTRAKKNISLAGLARTASQIDFYVNGVLENSYTTNLPKAMLIPWTAVRPSTASA